MAKSENSSIWPNLELISEGCRSQGVGVFGQNGNLEDGRTQLGRSWTTEREFGPPK